MALKLNSASGSITLTAEDGSGNVDISIPRAGFAATDPQLTDLAGLTPSDGEFIVGDGSNFVTESGATARTSLGLGSTATQDSTAVSFTGGSIDGTTIGGTTPAAGTFTAVTVDNIVIDGDVINYGAGDVTQTFSANSLTLAGGKFIYNYTGDIEIKQDGYGIAWTGSTTVPKIIGASGGTIRHLAATGSDAFTIEADGDSYFYGNVGIGITPSYQLQVYESSNAIATYISSDATTALGIDSAFNSMTSGFMQRLYTNNATFSGIGLNVNIDNVSATGQGINVFNQGTGNGIFIDQNGNSQALYADHEGTTQAGIYCQADALTTGFSGAFWSNSASHSTYTLSVVQDHASASAGGASITNDGTGSGIYVNTSGARPNNNNNGGVYILDNSATASRGPLLNVRANTAHTGSYMSFFLNESASSSSNTVQIQNEGTGAGLYIDQNGSGNAIKADGGNIELNNGQYIEEYAATGTSGAVTIDLNTGNNFSTALAGAVTYTFSNAATSGLVSSFTLKVVNNGSAITWPASVDWPSATAPTLSASGATDIFTFFTHDAGTTWYGFTAGQGMA